MKIFHIIILLFSINIYSQNNNLYSCDEIKKIIRDKSLVDTLSNGKLIARFDRSTEKIYKITIQDKNFFYYIQESLMLKIKKSIKNNDCKNIIIGCLDKPNKDYKKKGCQVISK